MYYPVAYLAVGTLAALLIGTKIVSLLGLAIDTSEGNNFYWMLLIGSQIGLVLYLIVQKQEDFWKKMILLGFLILVLFLRQVFIFL
jgi:hypothetical protein